LQALDTGPAIAAPVPTINAKAAMVARNTVFVIPLPFAWWAGFPCHWSFINRDYADIGNIIQACQGFARHYGTNR
jgi:hypothetical protein